MSESNSPGFEKLVKFINESLEVNSPVDIAEIEEKTGLSWTYVKKLLRQLKKKQYIGFHFQKIGNSWAIWKSREHIIKPMDDTCGRFLED